MIRLYVRHEVEDYARWRQQYDAFDAERRGMGVESDEVYRRVDDGNDVTVWHDFASREAAEQFGGSDRLRAVMSEAGVKGQPQVWMTERA